MNRKGFVNQFESIQAEKPCNSIYHWPLCYKPKYLTSFTEVLLYTYLGAYHTDDTEKVLFLSAQGQIVNMQVIFDKLLLTH